MASATPGNVADVLNGEAKNNIKKPFYVLYFFILRIFCSFL